MIYAIGNSHAHMFSNSRPGELGWGNNVTEYFTSYSANFHNTNPKYRHVLARGFLERHFPFLVQAINSRDLTIFDYVMFIVGEIDCRWHFPKRAVTQNRTIEDVVAEGIDEFFPAFLFLKESGYNVVGWGGQPSTNRDHNDDPDNPVYGDRETRNKISLLWNDMLEQKCRSNGMPFVSIIRELINPDGSTKMEYYMDDYHLTQKAMPLVIEACKKEGIIKC